jgi:hypothetical protein
MDKSELQKLTPDELLSLSEKNTSDFRWDRSEIYKAAFGKYESMGEKEKVEEMRKEVLILDLSTHKLPKKRFDFMMSGTTDKGEEWKYPNFEKDFSRESIEYYKNRTKFTCNPILKARYSDVVWELDRDVNFARFAVRSYLDCCPIYFGNEWGYELSDALDRAITIASMINDQNLIEICLKKHYELMKQLAEKGRFRWLIEIIESILKQEKKIRGQIDYAYLILTMEEAITDYAKNPDSFHIQRSFMELLMKIYQLRKNPEEFRRIKVRIAESLIEEAEWKKINYPNGNMVAAHFYEEAMRVYMDLGDSPEKVDELKIKIKEANEAALKTEYKKISTEIEIPREEIDQYLKIYKERKPIEIFQIMSLDKQLVPSYERSRQTAIEQSKQFIFQHIVPVTLMRGDICVKKISEEDEKLEYSAIGNFRMSYRLVEDILLKQIFDLLEKDHPKYIEELIQHLSSSEIINKERLEIIQDGLRAFENKEYVATIHILIFQIEGILRDLLGKLGLPTFSYRNNEMRERLLNDILATLSQVEGINRDFLKFIEIFLCDIRGDNYRNDIAHGLLTIEAFTRENALLLLLILIKLASYRVVKGPIKNP